MSCNMDKMELLRNIAALDFVILDLNLYLDTHPGDMEALEQFDKTMKESKLLKSSYEMHYGMLTSQDSFSSSYPWQWINEPWPWEYAANFEL